MALSFTTTTPACTWHFSGVGPLEGWALFTVNPWAGTLSIQSGWGDWSHRWSLHHLGLNDLPVETRLCRFLSQGSHDYVARKLMPRDQQWEHDNQASCRLIYARLVDQRVPDLPKQWDFEEALKECLAAEDLVEAVESEFLDEGDSGFDLRELCVRRDSSLFLLLRDQLLPAFVEQLRREGHGAL